MIKLCELSVYDGHDIYEMLQQLGPLENAFNNAVNGMTYEEYKEWLVLQHAWSLGERLPIGFVKQWTYWLMVDGIPVGYGKLREKTTEKSKKFGGNIGYAITPSERGKNYGSILFGLLIQEARNKGIYGIFSTVEKYNYSSKKIHEKYGGILVDEDEVRWYFRFHNLKINKD